MIGNKVWTVAQARQSDQTATKAGVPFLSLMELAGRRAADVVASYARGEPIAVLVGPGANGGDGLVLARHLARTTPVGVIIPGKSPGFPGAEDLIRAARAYGAEILDEAAGRTWMQRARILVDGLLGTGFHGRLQEVPGFSLLEAAGALRIPVYAIDLLSGVNGDSGAYSGPELAVAGTVTFGAAKWGHFGYPGTLLTGKLWVADIGLPDTAGSGRWMTPAMARAMVKDPVATVSKYGRGRVAVLGGSPGMSGAPVMAAWAALKTGAGLVDLMVPRGIGRHVNAPTPLMVWSAEETGDGALNPGEKDWDRIRRADAVVFGPGAGRHLDPRLLDRLVAEEKPLVIDADGLNLLARHPRALPARVVLTPHSGEMGRLLGSEADAVDGDRRQAVLSFADRFGDAGVLLKGRHSLAMAERFIVVNTTGGPELATAGSGDVLAGVIGALLAQGLPPRDALALGAYLHGWAGHHAVSRHGRAVTALDLIEALGSAWQSVEKEHTPKDLPERI